MFYGIFYYFNYSMSFIYICLLELSQYICIYIYICSSGADTLFSYRMTNKHSLLQHVCFNSYFSVSALFFIVTKLTALSLFVYV